MARKRRRRGCIIVLFVVCIFILGSAKAIQLAKNLLGYGEIEFKTTAAIDKKSDENDVYQPFQQGIVVYQGEALKAYDHLGKEQWTNTKKIKRALLAISQNVIYLGDQQQGTVYCIDEQGKEKWSASLEGAISSLKSNGQGQVVAFVESEAGGGTFTIFNPDGVIAGNIAIPAGHIMDVDIGSGENGMLAVSVLSSDNYKIQSNVMLYSTTGKLLRANRYDNDVIGKTYLYGNTELLIFGDKKLIKIDKEKGQVWKKDLDESISRAAWNETGFVVLNLINRKKLIIDTKNNSTISIIDMDGKEIGNLPLKGEIIGISTKENHAAAFTSRTLYVLSKDGKLIAEKKINNDIKWVTMLDKERLIIETNNKLLLTQIKYKEQ
ncbi:MAG: DUF5711 family protein [Bacillota bacterium]